MTLPEPFRVSPIIKIFRYGLLIAGIFYGASKYKYLRQLEAGKKPEKERRKEEKNRQVAEEQRKASERDIANLVAIFSNEPEPRFENQESNENNCTFKEVKTNPEETCTFQEVENKPLIKPTIIDAEPNVTIQESDLYSEQFNLSDVTPKTLTETSKKIPTINDTSANNDEDQKSAISSGDCNEYFVETFQNVPYAAPQNKESDFFPK